MGFGGAIYAYLDAADVGLTVAPEHLDDLIAIGREVKWLLNDHEVAQHPSDARLSGIYGTAIFQRLGTADDGSLHQRNVVIFADGEVDRSPTGSSTCARVAVLDASGELEPGQALLHDSIIGSRFIARVEERVPLSSGYGVVVAVHGTAYRTGEHRFVVDPDDDLTPGFVVR